MSRYQFRLHEKQKEALDKAAQEHGLRDGAALCRRVINAFLRDPPAFEAVIAKRVTRALQPDQRPPTTTR